MNRREYAVSGIFLAGGAVLYGLNEANYNARISEFAPEIEAANATIANNLAVIDDTEATRGCVVRLPDPANTWVSVELAEADMSVDCPGRLLALADVVIEESRVGFNSKNELFVAPTTIINPEQPFDKHAVVAALNEQIQAAEAANLMADARRLAAEGQIDVLQRDRNPARVLTGIATLSAIFLYLSAEGYIRSRRRKRQAVKSSGQPNSDVEAGISSEASQRRAAPYDQDANERPTAPTGAPNQ